MADSIWFEIAKTQSSKPKSCRWRPFFCSLCCCLPVVIWIILPFVLGRTVAFDRFLKPHLPYAKGYLEHTPATLPEYQYWPGCPIGDKDLDDFEKCAPPCFSSDLIPSISRFNKKLTYQKVSYPSRRDLDGKVYTLTGWWLPAATENVLNGTQAPRVVIQHGFQSNSNDWTMTLAAYYMRSLGFGVLLNNFRNHGYSSDALHNITTWGYEYHYDLLGAWDYLRVDSDGIMGGELPPAKVGILGFSMGAFVTINALTMEERIPAAWLESPPSSPWRAFIESAQRATPLAFDIPGFGAMLWFWLTAKADVDIEARTPLKNLPRGPNSKRPLQIAHNRLDAVVDQADIEKIVSLASNYPDKYDVKKPFYTNGECNGHNHVVSGLLEPNRYRRRLYEFWTDAFDLHKSFPIVV